MSLSEAEAYAPAIFHICRSRIFHPFLAECVTGSASELTGRRLDLSPAFISCWPLPFRRLLHLTSMGNIQIAGSFP